MSDIPDEVLVIAEAVNDEIFRRQDGDIYILSPAARKVAIARAILAERERCAAIAYRFTDRIAAEDIASAIHGHEATE